MPEVLLFLRRAGQLEVVRLAIVDTEGPQHELIFKCEGDVRSASGREYNAKGQGSSSRKAKRDAALQLLSQLAKAEQAALAVRRRPSGRRRSRADGRRVT